MNDLIVNQETTKHPYENLIQLFNGWIASLGYQVIHVETQTHRQKTLRIFIDFSADQPATQTTEAPADRTIGIEDCVRVSRAIEEKLDQSAEVDQLFSGAYELEVSSPGVDRPLRTSSDFQRFAGREVRIHTYRPLTQEEMENAAYQEKNPKQKNFYGTLIGIQNSKVALKVDLTGSGTGQTIKKAKAKKKALAQTNSAEGFQVLIPLPLISKANLEPQFDFESGHESE